MCIYLNLMILIKIIRGFISTQYPFSIDIQVIHNGVQHRADYRWTTADEVICLTAVIPPSARYSVNGGWGQPTEWTVINFWLEYSL
ncbi:hypothetical protein B9Z91_010445 [Morganella morganii subsp. morganii]|nr:hypothetical protein B9Z91_010445 [Morganella morganii subsp. morganii]